MHPFVIHPGEWWEGWWGRRPIGLLRFLLDFFHIVVSGITLAFNFPNQLDFSRDEKILTLFNFRFCNENSRNHNCNNGRLKHLVRTFTSRSPKFALKVHEKSIPRVSELALNFAVRVEMEYIDALPPESVSVDQAYDDF